MERRSTMLARARTVERFVTVKTPSHEQMNIVEHEEGVMGVLMIQCPSTGRQVSTGIEMLNVDQLPAVKARTVCSACGRVHEWTKHDAWLADCGQQYRVFFAH